MSEHYQILTGSTLKKLEAQVETAWKYGWRPTGGMTTAVLWGESRYIQAIVREDHEKQGKGET